MIEFTYKIKDEMGLHARPAGMLVKEAKRHAESNILIHRGSFQADLKRLFAVMNLCIKSGEEITIAIEGGDESATAKALQEFLEENV